MTRRIVQSFQTMSLDVGIEGGENNEERESIMLMERDSEREREREVDLPVRW